MTVKIQRIVEGVHMPDTMQEGIEEACEKQDAIDQIQTTKHRAIDYSEYKKTIEAGKDEIDKKTEKEYNGKHAALAPSTRIAEVSSVTALVTLVILGGIAAYTGGAFIAKGAMRSPSGGHSQWGSRQALAGY